MNTVGPDSYSERDVVLLSDGGGGTRTRSLIERFITKHLANPVLARLDDAACLTLPARDIAFTTDSFVVKPIFFPGGDIGLLAACGTINDLAMQGAEPKYLSLGLILEEGLPLRDLDCVMQSMGRILSQTGVTVVTGDTKVVERGSGAGISINTSGIGIRRPLEDVHVSRAKASDVIIVTGPIGDHGLAVLSCREGLTFDSNLVSDVAPLWSMIAPLLEKPGLVHCLRDPTRGGVAGALHDMAEASRVCIRIEEKLIPVRRDVAGACRMLGLDVLNVANEGKAVIVCPEAAEDEVLQTLRTSPLGREACVIGRIETEPAGVVLLKTSAGGERIIEPPSGEDLPRIC